MPDEPSALWIPNQNSFPGRNGYKPLYIVTHGTAGGSSAIGIAKYFQSTQGGNNPVSAHYVIGPEGSLVQCNNESDGAWANGVVTGTPGVATPDSGNGIRDSWWSEALNPNLVTISIEHVKASQDNSDPLTDAQKQASFTLIGHICDRHGIPKRRADAAGGITGHYSIDALNRSHCPGTYPWDELWSYLEGQNMGIPNGWHDDGTTLTAPNGHKVVSGFRQFILTHPWDAQNYPLEEEHGQNPLEVSNLALGGGTQQTFHFSLLSYAPSRGVFVSYVGDILLATRAQVMASPDLAALKTRCAAQQAAIDQIAALVKTLEAS